MKKLLTIFTLSLFAQLTFGQNCENERLIKEIDKFVFEIDSLMTCCSRNFESMHAHSAPGPGPSFFSERIYGRENNWHFDYEVKRTRFDNPDSYFNAQYYRYGKLVAIKASVKSARGSGLWGYIQNLETMTIIYVNDGKIIYYKGEKEDVKSIVQEHNLKHGRRHKIFFE